MISLPAIALTPGAAVTVPIPVNQLGSPVGAFVVSNESPWPLTVSWAGNSQTLAPWTANLYQAPGVQTFVIAVGGSGTFAGAEALVDVAAQGEAVPGSYPLSLPGQTTISGGSVTIGTISGPVTVENVSGGALSVLLGSTQGNPLVLPPGTTNGSESVAIPPGTAAIALVISGNDMTGAGDSVSGILAEYTPSVGQAQTPINQPASILSPTTYYGVLPSTSLSGSLEIVGSTPSGNHLSIEILPIFFPPGVVNIASIINTPENPVIVGLNPSPWLTANQPPIAFAVNFASTGITHIIPGTAGKTIYLFNINAVISAAGSFAGRWQDTVGNLISDETLQNGAPRYFPFSGTPLAGGVGVGLDFDVTAAGSSFYQGSVVYSLA